MLRSAGENGGNAREGDMERTKQSSSKLFCFFGSPLLALLRLRRESERLSSFRALHFSQSLFERSSSCFRFPKLSPDSSLKKKSRMRQAHKPRPSSAAAALWGPEGGSSSSSVRWRRPSGGGGGGGDFFRHRSSTPKNLSPPPLPRSLPSQEAITAASEQKTALFLWVQSSCDSKGKEGN